MENGFYQEDSLARTLVLPEKEQDLMEKGLVFGLNIGDLLGIYDQDMQLWKTSVLSLFADSTEFLVRLPKSGIMRNGRIYEQATWVRRTKENEYGLSLIPTPEASNGSQGAILNDNTKIVFLKSGKPRKTSNLPTPTVTLYKNNTMSPAQTKRNSSLINEINIRLRTPDANMAKRGPKSLEGYKDCKENGTHAINLNDQTRHEYGMKRLNPELPEWMMGYPVNWTRIDCEDAEMRLSLK